MAKKVLVAMSGGVDSTYSAIFLKEQGYDITGVTFKINECEATIQQVKDAKKVCDYLKIEHVIVDFTDTFNEKVIKYFVDSYKEGITPNPCVICNKEIKFGELNKIRKKLGCDYIATGHYARCEKIEEEYYIKKAVYLKKDQSYFLNQISKEVLPFIIFPLGQVESKEYVREYLNARNIEIANKKESQEICFVENDNLKAFLSEYIKPKEGNIIDEQGIIKGVHEGSNYYTIGQRRGLGVSNKEPLYVLNTDISKNIVYVGTQKSLFKNKVTIKNINVLSKKLLENKEKLYGRTRYRSKDTKIKEIKVHKNTADVIFCDDIRSIARGQFLVVYNQDNVVLGGQII
ncbi:MAG: tRNA 2-thiouridine(34) synthase MnmA [Clostridia bacterium]